MSRPASNLTRFFRNSDQFKALEYSLVPDIATRKSVSGAGGFEVWSVGCSTGEEPVSVAILLREILPPELEPRIVAIDRDPRVLETAARALYPAVNLSGVPRRLRERYFEQTSDGTRPRENVRACIRYECRSLEDSSERGVYDVVICRNVLTYADESGRRRIAEQLWLAMAPYSYLLIGGGETLFGVDDRFEYVPNDWSYAYRKRSERSQC